MRIIVINTSVFAVGVGGTQGLSSYGGLEEISWQVAKGLAARGHTTTLVAAEGSSCPGCTILPIGPPGPGPGHWGEHQAYNTYWQELLKMDCVIDMTWQKHSYLLKGEGRLKCPILGVCHAPISTMISSLPPNVEKPCFVCISNDQRSNFEALFNHEARTAYNGVDLDFYQPMDVPRTNRYLFLARFSTIKGPDLCLDACKQAGVGLDMVGDMILTMEPQLAEYCKSKSDGKQIRMLGACTRGETVWWFSQAHAMLHLNQRFREPFGLAPVESMACGTPVVAWNNGAMRETVSKDSGFLVKSLQEATDLIKSDSVSTIDRKKCREWASQFSIQRMVENYERLCVEAIESGW